MTEAIIERLRSLDLSDGGSHLSAIASCFYQPTFGWTGGSCEILRDLLIEILEGKDDNDDNDHAHAHGCDYGHHRCNQHQVSYDELGNERHKAVCELRGISIDALCRKYDYIDIYPEFIWAVGRAIGLRHDASFEEIINRLIHLLGEDECNFSWVESYMDAMGGKSNPAETSNESTDHVTLATPSSEDGTCPNPVQGASIIDKLDNERHKAIAELRKVCTKLDESVWTWIEDVAIAIGAQDKQSDKYESMLPEITDRLIHLLGGDEPDLQMTPKAEESGAESVSEMTKSAVIAKPESEDGGENCRTTDEKLNGESLIESLVKSTEELSRQGKVKFPPNEDGSLDSLKTVEEAEALIEDVKRRADQSHDSSPMGLENEIRITDELRDYLGKNGQEYDNFKGEMIGSISGGLSSIYAIADRIDEQFDRICEQQEKVLQDTIDYMTTATDLIEPRVEELTKRCEELQNELDEMTELREHDAEYALAKREMLQERLRAAELGCDANHRLAEANVRWCDNLLDLLRDAAREYEDKHYWAQVWHDRAEDMRMNRDELQEKCDRLKAKVEHQREQLAAYATMCDFDAIRALKRERNEHKHRADNAEGHVKSLERRLDAAHETYCALLNDAAREFRALTAERDERYQLLPKDSEGEYVHIGDVMEDMFGNTCRVIAVSDTWLIQSGESVCYKTARKFRHHRRQPVTVEQVIRDLTLGKITEAQAIERIEGIHGQG